jgi:predicted nucleotidyltransferase
MPVKSSNSSVLAWPSAQQVLAAARSYAKTVLDSDPRVLRVGLIGSYARGNQGPGSDADLLIELDSSDEPSYRRALGLPPPRLPVPVDLLVLTRAEIADQAQQSPRWAREVLGVAVWLVERESDRPST